MYICTYMYVVCAHLCTGDERGIMGVLLHHSPYSGETGSLREPGAMLAARNLVSTAHVAGVQVHAARPSFTLDGY